MIENEIVVLETRIANYERLLSGYYGRWYDLYRRNLEEMKRQLAELKESHRSSNDQDTSYGGGDLGSLPSR